jgi:YHS domain-containing protein
MRRESCGTCSNEIDADVAVVRRRSGGAVRYFCSQECRIAAEGAEPYDDEPADAVGEHACGAIVRRPELLPVVRDAD